MTEDDSDIDDLALALALRRLDERSVVPPPDPAREAALMAAFEAAQHIPGRRGYWGMAALAAAAAVLIAVGVGPRPGPAPRPALSERSESKGQSVQPPGEFVMIPGAIGLPAMESGSLVRIDVPVAMLPSLGVTPPSGATNKVRADLIVGQDGLARAVRLVN